jgi:hypothetical protein
MCDGAVSTSSLERIVAPAARALPVSVRTPRLHCLWYSPRLRTGSVSLSAAKGPGLSSAGMLTVLTALYQTCSTRKPSSSARALPECACADPSSSTVSSTAQTASFSQSICCLGPSCRWSVSAGASLCTTAIKPPARTAWLAGHYLGRYRCLCGPLVFHCLWYSPRLHWNSSQFCQKGPGLSLECRQGASLTVHDGCINALLERPRRHSCRV